MSHPPIGMSPDRGEGSSPGQQHSNTVSYAAKLRQSSQSNVDSGIFYIFRFLYFVILKLNYC